MARLVAVGFLSMVAQVVLLRELAVASFGVELIYLLGLGLWLAAGAAGAVSGRARVPDSFHGIDRAFLFLALLIPVEIAFLRGARVLFGGVPGAYLPLGRQFATAVLGLAPAGAILGWLFRRTAQRAAAGGGTLAAAYAWESAGGALGSVSATLSLYWGVPNLALGVACGLASAGVAAASRPARRFALPLFAALLALLAGTGRLDLRTGSWNHHGLVATADTPYGRIAITRAGAQVAVFSNDALEYESEGTEPEEFVHFAALQAPPGSKVLALGGGVAGIADELLRHAPSRVDYVEGNRAMYRALLPHLPSGTRRSLEREPVRVIFADPRRFLAAAGKYDLILVASAEPASGESNRFYTAEFFRLCADRLSPNGVVALRLPSSENLWTPMLARRNGSVHAALRSAFPEVLVIPGGTDTLLASRGSLVRDPEELSRRLRARGIAGRLVTPEYLRYALTNDRVEQVRRILSQASAPPNTDARPVCYRQAVLLWLGKFLPGVEAVAIEDRRVGIGLLAVAAALLALSRRKVAWRRVALVAVAGFAGMATESVVLLRYQAESGSLYQDIGLLLTSFMAGLSVGALAFDRMASRRPVVSRWVGIVVLVALALLEGALALGSEGSGGLFRIGPAAGILGACGALTAGLFGYASRLGVDHQERVVSPLYAADLLGGCLGSFLAGLLLLPLLGAEATSLGMAVLALAAILAL
jgi:spermidine synthase